MGGANRRTDCEHCGERVVRRRIRDHLRVCTENPNRVNEALTLALKPMFSPAGSLLIVAPPEPSGPLTYMMGEIPGFRQPPMNDTTKREIRKLTECVICKKSSSAVGPAGTDPPGQAISLPGGGLVLICSSKCAGVLYQIRESVRRNAIAEKEQPEGVGV